MISTKLVSDAPLRDVLGDSRPEALGFGPYAETIAEAIRGVDGPFTIGVFGTWGSGKTSLMRLVQRTLEGDGDVVCVWFNAWQYEHELHPLLPLVRLLAETADSRRRLSESTRAVMSSLRDQLRGLLAAVTLTAEVKVPYVGGVGVELSGKDGVERTEALEAKRAEQGLEGEALPSAVFRVLSQHDFQGTRVVVFVDDLDRCIPPKAMGVLESIKLVLSHPGFVFVLGVADEIIEGYLDHRYRTEFGIEGIKGSRYLQKLVQMEFAIPPLQGRLRDFVKASLEQVDRDIRDTLEGLEHVVEIAAERTPRAGVRFINQLVIDASISRRLETGGGDGIPLPFFAVTRALQARWRDLYRHLITSRELCEAVHSLDDDAFSITRVLGRSQLTDLANGEAVSAALGQDPDLRELLMSQVGKRWLEDHANREAASSFLRQTATEVRSPGTRVTAYDAFLSYRMTDQELVKPIAALMVSGGLRVMWDSNLTPGLNWRRSLDRALLSSASLVYFFGRDTPGSEWQERELDMAAQMMAQDPEFRIFPVLLPGSDADLLPAQARAWIWIDLREHEKSQSLEAAAKPLLQALRQPR